MNIDEYRLVLTKYILCRCVIFQGQSASRLMNCNSCHAGKANVSVPSRRGSAMLLVGLVASWARCHWVPTAQVERDFKLGLARLNICKQARQRHRQRPVGLVLFGFWKKSWEAVWTPVWRSLKSSLFRMWGWANSKPVWKMSKKFWCLWSFELFDAVFFLSVCCLCCFCSTFLCLVALSGTESQQTCSFCEAVCSFDASAWDKLDLGLRPYFGIWVKTTSPYGSMNVSTSHIMPDYKVVELVAISITMSGVS